MAALNTATIVYAANTTGTKINHPAIPGMSSGYWFTADFGSTTAKDDTIIPYRYGTELPTQDGYLSLVGTFANISESWLGTTRYYHGSTITHIGPGTNDVTDEVETDAIMFAHIGSLALSPDDTAMYWDRFYQTQTGGDYFYYNYHLHAPNIYEDDYENGRIVFSDGNYINPDDKHYGYMIFAEADQGQNKWQSILGRIHQPSVGGAHQSHLDVELPSVAAKNYIPGGMLYGSSSRYHAFYLTADGSNWKVYSRTFVLSSRAFTAEVDLGSYDFADPVFVSETNAGEYPLRASCGILSNEKIYFPVIYNGAASTYDLKIWRLDSADSLSSATLNVSTILTGSNIKPDCHMIEVDSTIYAVVGQNTGANLYSCNTETMVWTSEGQIVSNGSKALRVHGVSYQSSTRKFFVHLSGDEDVTGTYSGQGVYSFQVVYTRVDYEHFDFDVANNGFILRAENTAGYVKYRPSTYTWYRINAIEPDPVPTGNNVFKYDYVSPQFVERNSSAGVGGEQYYYDVTVIPDGRMLFCGLTGDNEGNKGGDDFLVALYEPTEDVEQPKATYWAHGGTGPDYFTAVTQKEGANYVYLTGYSKSQLVDLNELRYHPYGRRLTIDNANTEFKDLAITSANTIVTVGTKRNTENVIVTKYTSNIGVEWSKIITGTNAQIGEAIAVDSSDYIYVGGNTTTGTTSSGGFLAKLDSDGNMIWIKTLDTGAAEYITSMVIYSDNLYIALANTTTNTHVMKLATDGTTIHWQKTIPDFSARRIKLDSSGNIYLAGDDGTESTVFKLNNSGSLTWARKTGAGSFYDVGIDGGSNVIAVGANTGNAIITQFDSTGAANWSVYANVDSQLTGVAIDGDDNIYAIGYENQIDRRDYHPVIHAMTETKNRGIFLKYNSSGTLQKQNYMWRTDPDGNLFDTNWRSCIMDHLDDHIWIAGDDLLNTEEKGANLFRLPRLGFGYGKLHKDDNFADYFEYGVYPADDPDVDLFSYSPSVTGVVPTLTNASVSIGSGSHTIAEATIKFEEVFDGSSGLWNFFIAKFDLDIANKHLNMPSHMIHMAGNEKAPMYDTGAFSKFWQIGTIGDAIADDGNFFGYDILQYSANVFWAVGQVSGAIGRVNAPISGAYDEIFVRFDESAVPGREFEIYQYGQDTDEELYAITKLADGNLAVTGRTTGTLGGVNEGAYDVILSIFDTTANTVRHYQAGGSGNDRGVNLHDIGGNQIAIAFQTTDNVVNVGANTTTTQGGDDIGVMVFNYSTNTWNVAYQTGSAASEILDTNGRVSALLPGNVIAVVGHTTGVFADDALSSAGGSDVFLALFNLTTGEIQKYQVGSAAGDIGTCVVIDGGMLLVGGYTDASWTEPEDGIFVHFDATKGLKGVTTVD